MKTYILDAVSRYKKFSESLDVEAILCSKSWSVFNDTGIKEIYLFQYDGSLIISVSGKVTNATWKYIPVNQSILISTKIASYMLHPTFIDNIIFALQLDGTNQYSFMIDENKSNYFHPKSLQELNSYFENIEHKRIKEEQQRQRVLLAQQRAEQKRIEEEQRQQEQYSIEQERRQQEKAQEELVNRLIEKQKKAERKKEQAILKQHKTFAIARIIGYIAIIQ